MVSDRPPWAPPPQPRPQQRRNAHQLLASDKSTALTLVRVRQQHEYTSDPAGKAYKRIKLQMEGALPHSVLATDCHTRTIFRLRCQHTRFQLRGGPTPPCPHCGTPDSVEHMLLDCSDRRRHALELSVCARYNEAPPAAARRTREDRLMLLLGPHPRASVGTQKEVATLVARHALRVRPDGV